MDATPPPATARHAGIAGIAGLAGIDPDQLAASNPVLVARLHEEIATGGPITVARFMERALYEPSVGYYRAPARRPGREGDFLTAPETHPFFGFSLARQVAECWERLGRPDPFTIREYGPGMGTLAYDILAALATEHPEVAATARYRLCDVNTHRLREALAAMEEVGLGEVVSAETPDEAATSPITGVALANEVADALPCHQVVVRNGNLRERLVGWDEAAGWFALVEGPLSPALAAFDPVTRLAAEGVAVAALPEGSVLEICPAAASWIAEVGRGLARGYAMIVDYGYPSPELYAGHRLEGLLRGYRDHAVTADPLNAIGEQDLTAHVDFSLLMDAAAGAGMIPCGLTTQGDALAALGLGDFLLAMQQEDGVSLDDYYQTQAAVLRLIDPGGMGRFRVLGLAKDAPVDPPLRAFTTAALPF
ncbi:MAG TPA: SAM-dependent methyltransferase [Thermomicrobiales bacterium]|nr:SAM-dependent methyltransferase [Thermomicrobiales bacterium]